MYHDRLCLLVCWFDLLRPAYVLKYTVIDSLLEAEREWYLQHDVEK